MMLVSVFCHCVACLCTETYKYLVCHNLVLTSHQITEDNLVVVNDLNDLIKIDLMQNIKTCKSTGITMVLRKY